jgi:DNA mismatch repair protein MutS
MMKQYMDLKAQYPDSVLLFRVGDFYEAFGDDARYISRALGLVLTHRGDQPMAGIPHHALNVYLKKLVEQGNKVAICDQLEDPKYAKGLVKRDVTRVVTPGTLIEDDALSEENNYIAAIYEKSVALIDISTGDFMVESSLDAVNRYTPKHVIYTEKDPIPNFVGVFKEKVEDWYFDRQNSESVLKEQFKVNDISFLELSRDEVIACAAILKYLQNTQKRVLSNLKTPLKFRENARMFLDSDTLSNLDVLARGPNSLYRHMNRCVTSMGQRLLKRELIAPLRKKEEIEYRHFLVEKLVQNENLLTSLRESLSTIHDVERIMARVAYPAATPSDIVALRESLVGFEKLNLWIESTGIFKDFKLTDLKELREFLEDAVKENPVGEVGKGGVIAEGFSGELDDARSLMNDVDKYLQEYQEKVREALQTKAKVGYSTVFGYYVEISKSYKGEIPPEYKRKQTLVNSERYITPELLEMEKKMLHASEVIEALEKKLFEDVCAEILKRKEEIFLNSQKTAFMDVIGSFARLALDERYIMPAFSDHVELVESRHPTVEKRVKEFVPNDLKMSKQRRFVVLTGPNMSGKSTFIRQVALISIMAQAGSFVPAKKAVLKIFDRIFTRIGARDDIISNRSTFLVEMSEVATILHFATKDSLIILDEVGRGTSTFDGLSIAWSVSEYISQKLKAFTIFATHYNELAELEKMYNGVFNLTIKVVESEDSVIFLHKVINGSADKSYGIEVARIAGIPDEVIKRAYQVADALATTSQIKKSVRFLTNGEVEKIKQKLKKVGKDQMTFFGDTLKKS